MKKFVLTTIALCFVCSPIATAKPTKRYTQKQIDACIDKWIKAFRKTNGKEAIIRTDMLDEWKKVC